LVFNVTHVSVWKVTNLPRCFQFVLWFLRNLKQDLFHPESIILIRLRCKVRLVGSNFHSFERGNNSLKRCFKASFFTFSISDESLSRFDSLNKSYRKWNKIDERLLHSFNRAVPIDFSFGAIGLRSSLIKPTFIVSGYNSAKPKRHNRP
jgi:hypothetical protein